MRLLHKPVAQPANNTKNPSKSAYDYIGNYYYYNGNPHHDTFLRPIIEKPIKELLSDELFFLIQDFDKNIQFTLPDKSIMTKVEQSTQETNPISKLAESINYEEAHYQFIMLLRALAARGIELVQKGSICKEDAKNLIQMINASQHMSNSPSMQEFRTALEESMNPSIVPSLKT